MHKIAPFHTYKVDIKHAHLKFIVERSEGSEVMVNGNEIIEHYRDFMDSLELAGHRNVEGIRIIHSP